MRQTINLILIITLVSCSRNPKSSISSIDFKNDTLIKLTIDGINKEYLVHKKTIKDLSDFQKVILKFSNVLEYKSNEKLDITGEGFGNNYATSIKKHNDGFLVTNTISQNDSLIWIDTLLVDDRVWYFWEDSVFFKLKPHSQFYIAYKYFSDFVTEQFDTTKELYKDNGRIIRNYIDYDEDPRYWDKYLGNFKGRLINNLSIEDAAIYMWDARKRKFIAIYEP
jgi:hypothetical protein